MSLIPRLPLLPCVVGLGVWSVCLAAAAQAPPDSGPVAIITHVGPLPEPAVPKAEPARSPLDPPSPASIFQLEGEAAFIEGLRRELKETTKSTAIPPEAKAAVLPPPAAPVCPPRAAMFVPHYLCYCPLYFEQKHAERYARSIPAFQPLISAGHFYLDVALLPIKVVCHRPWVPECNTEDPSRGPDPLSPLHP